MLFAIGFIIGGAFGFAVCVLMMASGEADRHSERMMNEDKEDKGE